MTNNFPKQVMAGNFACAARFYPWFYALATGPSTLPTYLQSLLALHAPPRRQRLGEPGERLVREPGLVVEDVEDLLQVVLVLLHVELRVRDQHALALPLLEPHQFCQVEVIG